MGWFSGVELAQSFLFDTKMVCWVKACKFTSLRGIFFTVIYCSPWPIHIESTHSRVYSYHAFYDRYYISYVLHIWACLVVHIKLVSVVCVLQIFCKLRTRTSSYPTGMVRKQFLWGKWPTCFPSAYFNMWQSVPASARHSCKVLSASNQHWSNKQWRKCVPNVQ